MAVIKVAAKTKIPGAVGEANKIKADNLKDYTRDTLSTGFDVAKSFNKDFASKRLPTLESKIDHIFSETTGLWKESITAVNRAIFKGDARSQEILGKLMRDGNSVDRSAGDKGNYEQSIKKFIYSAMTPDVWRMQDLYPVLLDTAWDCNTPGIGVRQWTDRKNVDDNIICRDGQQFQLWAVKGSYGCKSSGPCGIPRNCNNMLQDLPGAKDIRKPIKDWGEMSLFTMANRYVIPTIDSASILTMNQTVHLADTLTCGTAITGTRRTTLRMTIQSLRLQILCKETPLIWRAFPALSASQSALGPRSRRTGLKVQMLTIHRTRATTLEVDG